MAVSIVLVRETASGERRVAMVVDSLIGNREIVSKTVGPQVYARVVSATSGATAQDLTLQVEDYGAMNALEVNSIR